MRTTVLLAAFMLSLTTIVSGQEQTPQNGGKNLPSITLGAGLTTFNGDVGKSNNISSLSTIRNAFSLDIEQRFANTMGISLYGVYGKVARDERDSVITINNNFQSSIMQFGINFSFHFDNGWLLKEEFPVAPYIFTGFSYLMFNPYGDKVDKNGKDYYYWSDGSIRDLPELNQNQFTSVNLVRDYDYETQLTDSSANYKRSTFALPIGFGLKFKISESIVASMNASYTLTFSDYLDNIKKGSSDKYFYGNFGITYRLGRNTKEKDRYSEVDFTQIDNYDFDGDGVKDFDDECGGTPKGIKVDSKGCPEDDDKDGIPNYKDKEANSKKGVSVDTNGVMLTDALIKKMQQEKDSLVTERQDIFTSNPSNETLKKIDENIQQTKKENSTVPNNPTNTSELPAEFKPADLNKDGVISSQEISAAIDAFFDGSGDYTVEKLHKLIDFFFEQ